jgi:hypothetical protein
MKLNIETASIEELSVDGLATICFESDPNTPALAEQGGWLQELIATGEFSGKLYEIAILHRPRGLAASAPNFQR